MNGFNVYDFDKTVCKGDSTVHFWLFCVARQPKALLRLPAAVKGILGYKLGIIPKTRGKEAALSFLKNIKNPEQLVVEFWDQNISRIYPWYLSQKKENDVIISASPEFLLAEACRRLGVGTLIASKVDIGTGSFLGENCYGEEKPLRFREVFGESRIDCFYSDSHSDDPMARLAEKSYIIRGGEPHDWGEK